MENEVIETEPIECSWCSMTIYVPAPRPVQVTATGAKYYQTILCSACHQKSEEILAQIRESLGKGRLR